MAAFPMPFLKDEDTELQVVLQLDLPRCPAEMMWVNMKLPVMAHSPDVIPRAWNKPKFQLFGKGVLPLRAHVTLFLGRAKGLRMEHTP